MCDIFRSDQIDGLRQFQNVTIEYSCLYSDQPINIPLRLTLVDLKLALAECNTHALRQEHWAVTIIPSIGSANVSLNRGAVKPPCPTDGIGPLKII